MLGPGDVVAALSGRWAALSNFATIPVTLDAVTYPTAEHAFNAAKTCDPVERARVAAAPTPAAANRAGRAVTLRPGWDDTVRYAVMDAVLEAKFTDPAAADVLAATGDALLVEGNTWHDQHWGQCTCPRHRPWPGANHLGRALMRVRARMRGDRPDRWVRVAVTGHRPHKLTADQATFARTELARLAVKLRDQHGTAVAITGAARGADTWWADAAADAGLAVWAYCPFTAQADTWTPAEQDRWRRLRADAARVVTLGGGYDVRLLHARNDLMIRDADLLVAVWDPQVTTGGTASTVAKARAAGRPVVVVDVAAAATRIRR
jgi:ribA/ribD-fused uncharacterized protein